MSKPLQSISLNAPGFLGLNTQQDSVNQDNNYCLAADNLVIDKAGRIAARRGWEYVTTDDVVVNLKDGISYIDESGTVRNISWSETKFYTGCETLTEITPTTTDTITSGDWSAAVMNDTDGIHVYFYQKGYHPLALHYDANDVLTFQKAESYQHSSGTPPKGGIVTTAFGRTFVADVPDEPLVLYFSDVLGGIKWNTGTAGVLNLAAVIPDGAGAITGIAEHNGLLVIFLENHIIMYGDGDNFQATFDVDTLSLVDVLEGVGCVHHDTIQNVGNDLVFLSLTGLRSFGRTIQEKSLPLRDLSLNIRDDLINDLDQQTRSKIRSAYSAEFAFYLLLFPDSKTIYCFDTRQQLQNGAFRVTRWTGQKHRGLCAHDTNLFFFQEKGVAQYRGYRDNGANYNIRYRTNYLDFGDATRLKMLKKLNITTIGGVGQELYISPAFDYKEALDPYTYTLSGSPVFEFNVGEYAVATYSTGLSTDNTKASVGGSGNVLQLQAIAEITGFPLAIQKVDLFIKQGRVI